MKYGNWKQTEERTKWTNYLLTRPGEKKRRTISHGSKGPKEIENLPAKRGICGKGDF